MITTLDRTPDSTGVSLDDHRPGPAARAAALIAGGILFAVGNTMHPLRHDDAAREAPTWLASHVVFGAGAVLMAAGLGLLARRLAPSRTATTGLGLLWLGLVLTPVSSINEGYVAPAMGDAYAGLETSLLWFSTVAGTSTLLGPLLVAVGAVRHRLLPGPVALCLPALSLGGLLMGVVPAEGWSIIPGAVVFGLGMAAAGWVSRHRAETS